MALSSEAQASRVLGQLLATSVRGPRSDIDAKLNVRIGDSEIDVVARVRAMTFVVECKISSEAAIVALAVEHAKRVAKKVGRSAVPLVAVPYMGDVGRERCEQAGVGWFDLSGNAHIEAPGVFVHVEGKPNRFKRPGRPSTVFAPRSSRVVRHLLIHVDEPLTQRDLSRATSVGEGFTSRIVRRLEADGYVTRDASGAVKVANGALLLDAWTDTYDFSKHQVLKGHVTARSGEELLHRVTESLAKAKRLHAATGLGAAWQMTHFAAFRLVTIFLAEPPSSGTLQKLSWREEARGANLWLVVPNDEGVFYGAAEQDGVRCVHPVQAYLDLQAQPERATEAAKELRTRLLQGIS
jgi:hypothetical protein